MRKTNFEARTECEVLKINLDASGKHATGVTYVDTSGAEWEQPADIVLVCAFAFNNVHMLLVSDIGRPYDPSTREGTIGRSYAYQTTSGIQLFFDDKIFNPFIASGALGQTADDFNGDGFDHSGLNFVGGAGINLHPDQRPSDPEPSGAARHAALGREVEAGDEAELPAQLLASPRRAQAMRPMSIISTSIRPTRIGSAGRCCE